MAPLADPLANLIAPSQPSTQFTAGNYAGTLQPGTYVGGITVSGNSSVTLAAGIYYLTVGGLNVGGNAKVTGTAVMVYITGLTGSNPTGVAVGGNASVTLTPPTSDTYQGVVIFQDRASHGAITVSGNGTLNTTGTVYAAGATVTLSGNETDGNPTHTSLGSEWIVGDLVLSGNAKFTITADANNRNQDPNAFRVAGSAVSRSVPALALTAEQAAAAVQKAVALWAAAGLDTGTLQGLSQTTVVVAPLSADYLGRAAPGVIYLDPTADGYGWFTDPSLAAAPPPNEIDLLTVVAHELGHEFGLMDGNGTALMAPTLDAGVRILPDAGDLAAPHATLAATRTDGITHIRKVIDGQGKDILVSDANNTQLTATAGSSPLFDRSGEVLKVNRGDGILLTGTAIYGQDVAALDALLATWDRHAMRDGAGVSALVSGVAYADFSGTHTAAPDAETMVQQPIVSGRSTPNGSSEQDWFFAVAADVMKNKRKGEIVLTL